MSEIKGKLLLITEPITTAMIFGKAKSTDGDSNGELFGGCDGSREKLQAAEIIFSTNQFGYGRSSEIETEMLRASTIKAIVARSFGRQFFRHAVNAGLPLFTAELPETISDKADVTISLTKGTISIGDEIVKTQIYPRFLQECFEAGSPVNVTRQMLGKN